MIECFIRDCTRLDDPADSPEIMSNLSDTRKEKILKYKMPADRKRGLCAGLLICDNLKRHGKSQDDITISDNGRPCIDGMDFNISHSGDYVIMALSDSKVGCDIEHVLDRNYSVANRYFSADEKEWMNKQEDSRLAFYRIWTARESYIKLTGEGILLDFKDYEVSFTDYNDKDDSIPENLISGEFLGNLALYREGEKEKVIIAQWLYDSEYVISVCTVRSGDR